MMLFSATYDKTRRSMYKHDEEDTGSSRVQGARDGESLTHLEPMVWFSTTSR